MTIRAQYYVECDAQRCLGCVGTYPEPAQKPPRSKASAMVLARAAGWRIDTAGCQAGECVATCPACQQRE